MSALVHQSPIVESSVINGVYTVPIKVFTDERGRFMETFRREWFPQVNWDKMQSNRSESKAGVARGLHYHFHQVDYWHVTTGRIRAGLVDLRPSSPTYRAAQTIDITPDNNIGLFIPVGVAHGFYALTDCTLIYIVNNYYDGGDEFGVMWNDPALGVEWGVESAQLSPRDKTNLPLRDIPQDKLPR
jgi:dTDP-4-dehydrorhamnose 3,5-epimerase